MNETFELTPALRNSLKKYLGWTDKQMDNLPPKMLKFITSGGLSRLREYKIIAEVEKGENCMVGLKTGAKYVFTAGGVVLPDECTGTLCLWALAPLVPFLYMVWDRIAEGLNPDSLFPDHVGCLDTGVECGGWGKALFRIYCIKESPPRLEELLNRKYVAQPR